MRVCPLLTVASCCGSAECDHLQCFGVSFESADPQPASLSRCYVKDACHFQPADLSFR